MNTDYTHTAQRPALPYFPFPSDEYDLTMGTQALPDEQIIIIEPDRYCADLSAKEQLLTDDHRYYYQALEGTAAMQWEALAHLLPLLARQYPQQMRLEVDGPCWRWTNTLLGRHTVFTLGDATTLPYEPLDWLGRQVQEDLLLMGGGDGQPLVAGQLCSASSWCLDDKIGQPFLQIHAAVPQFMRRIGHPAALAMQRLKAGHPMWRMNWSITTTDRLNCAPSTLPAWLHTRDGITVHNAGERCYLRLERQTLSRMPTTGAILFTIHIYSAPIAAVVADPAQARRLTAVVKGLPRVVREYKGMASYADALVAYLEDRCRAIDGRPRTMAARTEPVEPTPLTPQYAHVARRAQEPRAQTTEPRVQWLHRHTIDEPLYEAGIWEWPCGRYDWLLTVHHTYHVLEGRAIISSPHGDDPITAGDLRYYPPNTVAVCTVLEPLRLLIVASA